MNYIFLDAETDGLYGPFVSVAMVLTDADGNELEKQYIGLSEPEKHIRTEWVRENVLPIMGEYEKYDDEHSLLEAVWSFWRTHAQNAYIIIDVMHPVESRLMSKCVSSNIEERLFQGPFPMLDISSMLYVIGIDPLKAREELVNPLENGMQHNALYDARTTLAIWKKYILPRLRNK
ncbi:hypothetical protein D081_1356 [Anaerovibrio sp. JC8]|uniref:hypothetical protein n=1 Tax=Anaerovibrio sp. JC8 TaxID=1240085 RepID=UPI000A0EBF42|nr:hypothetical protein [Anaerovibrio sp. JC8]ORU00262.1 hypothetical protein D081_1356 [Anaerovibrio sp. JC8]